MISHNDDFQNYIKVGREKCETPFLKTLVLAILAGAFIAAASIGFFFGTTLVSQALGAAVFAGGLAVLLLAGSELFTESCLLVMPIMKKEIPLLSALKNLATVYLGNMIGAVLVALIATESGVFSDCYQSVISSAANQASLDFGEAFSSGILCGILLALAVPISFRTKSVPGKIIIVSDRI